MLSTNETRIENSSDWRTRLAVSVREAADLLGWSTSRVRNNVGACRLDGIRAAAGGQLYVTTASIAAMLAEQEAAKREAAVQERRRSQPTLRLVVDNSRS
ncbi:hypothetical protein [Blastochloris tepida]|uniref:Helix-turn-helix domain-containing protein n=1 Tax=Blastochloris tepida TaxID=2233851 RepID=A0A348FXU5_9HYPH|nr:hypothetical protein [Blastochloris tepida]BBF92128.1 hypothetical protein BLTE_08130 [Blastochloris tepida]